MRKRGNSLPTSWPTSFMDASTPSSCKRSEYHAGIIRDQGHRRVGGPPPRSMCVETFQCNRARPCCHVGVHGEPLGRLVLGISALVFSELSIEGTPADTQLLRCE